MVAKKTKKVSEAKVCRDIIDRQAVLETQVLNLVVDKCGDSVDQDVLKQLSRELKGTFNAQTQGLLTQVSKRFQDT